MKKRWRLILAIMMGLGAGCNPPGGGKPILARATTPEGQTMTAALDGIEKELSALEGTMQQLKREPGVDSSRAFNFDLKDAAAKGPENAKLTMVVFSDFECPFCALFAATSKQLLAKYPNDLRLVFMNFPLGQECNPLAMRTMHANACLAAEAVMAAKDQGKFWEMHDYLFSRQRTLNGDSIAAWAATQGMDGAKIKDAIAAAKYKDQIGAQAGQMGQTGARGTPTVFINGQVVTSPRWDNLDSSVKLLDKLLNPSSSGEQKSQVPKTVNDAVKLPAADVAFDDGTRLADRLKDIQDRIAAINKLIESLRRPPDRNNQPMNRPMGPDMNKVYSFNAAGGPAAGPEGAPVTVVVFADILSPQAQMMLDTVNDLKTKFPDKARVVFKNLPDPRRPNAALAHQAAMEAFAQGKFWEMLPLIVKNRDAITPESLRKLAGDAGLNLTQYDAAIKDNRHGQELANNAAEAAGASAMPPLSYFVNGKFSPDARPPALEAIIQKNLEGAPK